MRTNKRHAQESQEKNSNKAKKVEKNGILS